jgi:hypothetical protein
MASIKIENPFGVKKKPLKPSTQIVVVVLLLFLLL